MVTVKHFYKFLIMLILSPFWAFAQKLTDKQIVDKHIPPIFFNAKDIRVIPSEPIEKEDILRRYFKCNFGNKDGARYLLVVYDTSGSIVDNPESEFVVIKISKNGDSVVLPKLKNYETFLFQDVSPVRCVDLDEDGIDEVIVTNLDTKGRNYDSHILKWSDANLEHVTPLNKEGYSILINLSYSWAVGGPKPVLLFDEFHPAASPAEDGITYRRAMELTNKGFLDLGTFDFVDYVIKDSHKVKEQVLSEIEIKPGVYTLDVKNLSKHEHAIRAEITLNGTVVLKPGDFCAKPNSSSAQKNSKGPDDESDKNEDGLKRCVPKSDVYADVTLAKVSSIKVKLYGNKHSKLLVSLKRKN